MKIAILGGTGSLGKGLASRWIKAGHDILIGSRDLGKAHPRHGFGHSLYAGSVRKDLIT